MFQLLQPIWLFALTGFSIPVIIHLWNRRPGKTMRVGSIALVTESTVSQKKSIKLSEILLLLLRCLLLACITFALATPFWKSPANKQSKGWVLMSRTGLAAVYEHFKPMVDSLLQAGMEFHYFEERFTKADFTTVATATRDSAVPPAAYRTAIALLNEQTDPAFPLYVFTDNYLRHFTGRRSAVSLNLHWYTFTPDTGTQKKINDTTPLRITIFTHAYANDARYLKAALDAIRQFSNKNIITTSATSVAAVPAKQDWLYWLADEVVPADKKASNIFNYAKGKSGPNSSYILPAGAAPFDAIALYASIAVTDSMEGLSSLCWKDGFGHPLLTNEQKNNTNYYRFYTHIDPVWNELPWSNSFPQLLYQLLYSDSEKAMVTAVTNKTIIDNSQLVPVLLTGKEARTKPMLFTETNLSGLFWIIVFILFFAERCLSFYHRKIPGNG